MNSDVTETDQAIQNSYAALHQGNRSGARYWAQRATWLSPDREEPWLILAAVSSPHASLAYLQRALKINPTSQRALAGMRWAQARMQAQAVRLEKTPNPPQPFQAPRKRIPFSLRLTLSGMSLVAILLAAWVVAAWMNWPDGLRVAQAFILHSSALTTQAPTAAGLIFPTRTASPTWPATATPLPSATATLLSSPTPPPTATQIPTVTIVTTTPAVGSGAEPAPGPTLTPEPVTALPTGQKQVVVDLSEQHLYAYQGRQLVFSFVASTGQGGGTLTGTFPILDKIENAYSDPWGFWMPDWLGIYYIGPDLENGIHSLPVLPDGTQIWGNDIGKPITYGCVVLGPQDAKMLYNWVDIGTLVVIQQ